MPFVLDVSACGSILLPAQRSPLGNAVVARLDAGERPYVPWIWWFEVRNTPLMALKGRRVDAVDLPRIFSDIEFLQTRVETDSSPASGEVVRLALRHGLTAYDAAYLELAMRLSIGLATLDEALRKAAIAESVALLQA